VPDLSRVFHPEAEQELHAAYDWYEERSPRVAGAFFEELELVLGWIAEAPLRFSLGDDGTRLAVLPIFPFNVIYYVDGAVLWIVAVAHQRRRPGYWKDRIAVK